MIRIVQVAVVALWLSTTAWLVRGTWFPDESRFVTVELREVMDAMFVNWHESAEMVVLQDDHRIGQMRISASDARTKASDGSTTAGARFLSSTGSLTEFHRDSKTGGDADSTAVIRQDRLIWTGNVGLGDDYQFSSGEVVLRLRQQNAKVELGYNRQSQQLKAQVVMNAVTLFDFNGSIDQLTGPSQGGLGVGMMPFPMSSAAMALLGEELKPWLSSIGLDSKVGAVSSPEMAENIKSRLDEAGLTVTSTFGRTKISGRPMAVYLVTFGTGDPETTVKLYIGEDGRPVKLDAPFGYSALAEVLVPEHWSEEDAAPIAK